MTNDGAIKSFIAGSDGDVMLMSEIASEGIKLKCMGILKPIAAEDMEKAEQ